MKHFQTMLDRHGSNLDLWPQSEAAKAKRFLLSSEEARRAYDNLARLESLIVRQPAGGFPGERAPSRQPVGVRHPASGAAAAADRSLTDSDGGAGASRRVG
jgi:hypothetical protein